MRPVLEEEPPTVDEPIQPRSFVRAEAAPRREIVCPVEDVDRIELEPTHVFDETRQSARSERARPRSRQMLSLEEERRNGAQREDGPHHEGAYSNIRTERATSPAFIARNASFTSSSFIRRVIISSSFKRPCM